MRIPERNLHPDSAVLGFEKLAQTFSLLLASLGLLLCHLMCQLVKRFTEFLQMLRQMVVSKELQELLG